MLTMWMCCTLTFLRFPACQCTHDKRMSRVHKLLGLSTGQMRFLSSEMYCCVVRLVPCKHLQLAVLLKQNLETVAWFLDMILLLMPEEDFTFYRLSVTCLFSQLRHSAQLEQTYNEERYNFLKKNTNSNLALMRKGTTNSVFEKYSQIHGHDEGWFSKIKDQTGNSSNTISLVATIIHNSWVIIP